MSYAEQMHSYYTSIRYLSEAQGVPLMQQALALATEAQDEDAIYELNFALFVAQAALVNAPAMLAAFDAVAERRLANPERFPNRITKPIPLNLDVQATLVIAGLGANAAIDRDAINHTLSLLRRLNELSGTVELNVPREALIAALRLGDVASWGTLATKLEQRPPSAMNHECTACLQHDLVYICRVNDGVDAGIAAAERMLREGTSCQIEPETTLAELLVPALLNGNSAFVKQHFARVYGHRVPYTDEQLILRTPLLALAALTENVALGLELFESLLPDLALVRHEDVARMEFFANAALLLDRATARGLGQRSVRDTVGVLPAQGLGEQSETVATLAPKLWAAAEKLAARFDAGRGNTFRRDQIAEIRSWATASIPLPLGEAPAEPFTFEPPRQPQNGTGWAARARVRAMLLDWPATIETCDRALADPELDPSTLSEVLAYRLRARTEIAQNAAEVDTIADLDPQTRHQLSTEFDAFTTCLFETGKPTRAAMFSALGLTRYDVSFVPSVDQLSVLLEQFEDASASDLSVLESYLAFALLSAERPEEAADWAIRSADHCSDDPDRDIRHDGQLFTARLLTQLSHPEARPRLERLVADSLDVPSVQVTALMMLAQVQAEAGELTSSAELAQRASYLYASIDAPKHAAHAAEVHASVLEDLGDLAGAIHATGRILELTNLVEDYDQLPVRLDLGRLLVSAGQAEQALTVLQHVDSELAAGDLLGSPISYACAYWLGRAHLSLENPEDAAKLWRAALNLATSETGAPDQIPLFSKALGNLLADYGQWDASLEAFETMRGFADTCEDPQVEVGLNERVGLITCCKGDPAGLETLAHARARAEELDAPWLTADITDSLARGLQALERTDEAVATALEASDLFAAVDDQMKSRESFRWATITLASAGRVSEALALLEPVASDNDDFTDLLAALHRQDS